MMGMKEILTTLTRNHKIIFLITAFANAKFIGKVLIVFILIIFFFIWAQLAWIYNLLRGIKIMYQK